MFKKNMATNLDDVLSGDSRSHMQQMLTDLNNDDSSYENTKWYYENYLGKTLNSNSDLPAIKDRMAKSQEYRVELEKYRAQCIQRDKDQLIYVLLGSQKVVKEVESNQRPVSDLKQYNEVAKKIPRHLFRTNQKRF